MYQRAAELILQHHLARTPAARMVAGLRRIGCLLGGCEAERVLCQGHVELVEHHVHTGLLVGVKTQLSVELRAPGFAVVSVTLGIKGAVVGDQRVRTNPPGVLPVAAAQSIGAGVILCAELRLLGRVPCKCLDHAA